VLKLVEPWGYLDYSFRYNFRRAASEGPQNGRFESADPLQLRQRVSLRIGMLDCQEISRSCSYYSYNFDYNRCRAQHRGFASY
jgi:hypothetical protein